MKGGGSVFTIQKCVSGGYKIVDFGSGTTQAISAKRAQSLLKSGKARLRTTKKRKGTVSPF